MDEPSEPPSFDYAALMRQAILDVVRRVLARVADKGLPGEHHFYLTFATGAEGVELPARQRQQFPEEMTIILQHQFWNLAVDEVGLGVTLRFSGRPERVRVPWTALRVFADPSVGFALKLPSNEGMAPEDAAPESQPTAPAAATPLRGLDGGARGRERPAPATAAEHAEPRPERPGPATDGPASDGKVVQFGAFRRRPDSEADR